MMMDLKRQINTSHIQMLRRLVKQYVKLMLNARLSLFLKSIVIFSSLALRLKSQIKMEKQSHKTPSKSTIIIMNVDLITLLIRPLQ